MHSHVVTERVPRRRLRLAAAVMALAGGLAFGLLADGADAAKKGVKFKTMTMNVYLGADLGPALQSNNVNQAVDAGGEIANQVDRTNFPLRAQALAQEILTKKPDLVGLQEVALWRTGPVNLAAVGQGNASATDVEYDFLELLLAELNKGGAKYEAVVVKQEFDAELPVNDDGQGSGLAGADHNERLTMRDVILRKVSNKVKVSNPTSGTFNVLLRVEVGGAVTLDVTRGWTAVDAKIKGSTSKKFRFVNTHLEAFDSSGQNPGSDGNTYGRGDIRAAQASQLFAAGGPATGKIVILVGDINSDDDTVQPNGDQNAYNALLAGGFSERSTANPLSCCLDDPNLVSGSAADFDHQVDHILTNSRKVKLVNSSVLGLAPVNGLWPSDHAAVFSTLRVPAKKK
jgi:endonuclease/exonuclease/phosphatase family metal-dependent hydrolase